jgi:DNA-binding PadR family transcriptional regulator
MTSHSENRLPPRKNVRNPAEYPLLGFLAMGPAHGYEICRVLRAEIGSIRRLGKSQIYALLAKLEQDGLVMHERVGQENLPSKNVFTIAPEGRQLLMAWVSSPVTNFRDLRLEFLTKLYVAGQLGGDREEKLVRDQLAACHHRSEQLANWKNTARTELERRTMEFRLAVMRAAVSWLESLLADSFGRPPGDKSPQE